MTEPNPNSRVWRKRAWGSLLLIVALLLLFPWLLAKTSLRDRLLTAIVGSDQVTVRSSDASFGYVAPLSLTGLHIESADKSAVIEVQRIASEHSWLGLLLSRPELGTFRFDQPSVDIRIDPEAAAKPETQQTSPAKQAVGDLPQLVAEVRDASIVVRSSETGEPPIDVSGVDMTFRIVREQERSVLRIDPTTIFDHQQLTPDLCGQGLQLVAPLLADELAADGEFSMRLNEFDVPLGDQSEAAQNDIRIAGEVELHRASVTLQNTVAKNLVALITKLVGQSMPDQLTVAEGVKVRFKVADGRIQHEGLALVLPHGDSSIKIESSGSVGLDETLDLEVAIVFPGGMLGGSNLATTLTREPVVVAVGGTFDAPEIGLASQSGWVQSIAGLISGDEDDPSDDQLSESLMELVGGMLEGASERETPILDGPILRGLRDRLRGQREQPEPPEPPEVEQPTPL